MAAYAYKEVCHRADFMAMAETFEGKYHRLYDPDANYDGDSWIVAADLLDAKDATIADLRERHEAFVQAVRDAAYEACLFSSGEIHRSELLAIVDSCDAELGKGGK